MALAEVSSVFLKTLRQARKKKTGVAGGGDARQVQSAYALREGC